MSKIGNSSIPASTLLLASLTLLAFLGNSLRVHPFPGMDFIFGSVAILLVIRYFGPTAGCVCAALAAIATYRLWGHPYNIMIYTLEAAFVGFLLKPGRRNILLLDGVFWLLLGLPLVWFIHHVVMGLELREALFVALTQSVNGIGNAMVAGVLVFLLSFRRPPVAALDYEAREPFHEMLFNLIVAAVILPTLIITVLNWRHEEQHIENELINRLEGASRAFVEHLDNWHRHRLHAIQGIAKGAGLSGMVASEELEQYVELITSAYPDIQNVNLADALGTVFGVYPPVSERGEPSIGPVFPELIQLKKILGSRVPTSFELLMGKEQRSLPVVIISVPILAEKHLLGYALGAVNFSQVPEFLISNESNGPEITLVNAQNQVLASSNPARKPGILYSLDETRAAEPATRKVLRLAPRDAAGPSIKTWRGTSFFMETPVPAMESWKVMAEIQLASRLQHMLTTCAQNLLIILSFCALALPLAHFISRRFIQPVERLTEMAMNLPDKLFNRESIDWPNGGSAEFIALMTELQSMTLAIEHRFRELEESSADLEKMNQELRKQINESRRTEEALREREERYREMSDLLPQPVFEMDLDGRFTFVNRAALEAFGYSKGEALGDLKAAQVFARDDFEGDTGDVLQYLSGEKTGRGEYGIRRKDGRTFPAIVYSSLISREGRAAGFRGIVVDLTDQKKAETELITRQKLESLGVLAGGLAHDYNNILTGILGNISLAKMFAIPGDRVMKRLEQLELAAMKAKDLTQQLLTFARGGAPIKRTTSIARLLESAVHFALLGSNVRCEMEIDTDLWASDVDEGQITQVIHNIVLNAAQAMPEGGVVRVRASNQALQQVDGLPAAPGDFVKISITDEGYGIPTEHLSRVFDPYFTTKQKGSGLGLATAYSIIRKHGGFITAESELGAHTTFVIHIPASDKEAPATTGLVLPLPRGQYRVLIMDDEEVVREVVGEMLEQLGYIVAHAQDGLEAIQLYREAMGSQTPFHAVIMDLTIPGGMGGREAILRLLEIDPHVKAIVSSGYSGDVVMSHYKRFGFKGVVPKPFKMAELAKVLEEIIAEEMGDDDEAESGGGFMG